MSCHYPDCMMGGGLCPHTRQCEEESSDAYRKAEEERRLDLEEQKLRIELMKKKLAEGGENGI